MNVPRLNDSVTREAAAAALLQYRQHRNTYDRRDWDVERIYRAISKGKTVISANEAIIRAGLNDKLLPHLAIARADCERVILEADGTFCNKSWGLRWAIPIKGFTVRFPRSTALLPRIPPQYRPPANKLHEYHMLWEANWEAIPSDPYLLKRIGKDAWVVLAAWDLTEVELSVLRAHEAAR